MSSKSDTDPERDLASPKEQAAIQLIREKVAVELEELQRHGYDFEHTTGDIFLLRVLRGNDNDVEKSVAWYKTCLAVRKEENMDAIFCEIRDLPYNLALLPMYPELSKVVKVLGNEDTLRSPRGDLVYCEFPGGTNWDLVRDQLGYDALRKYWMYFHESRLAALDRLSRQEGKLVKTLVLTYVQDVTMPPKDLLDLDTKVKTGIMEKTGPEIIHKLIVLGLPQVFHNLLRLFTPLLPVRTRQKLIVTGREFMENESVIAEVGAPLLATIVKTRTIDGGGDGNDDSLMGKCRILLPGTAMQKGLVVKAGQHVVWNFKVGDSQELAAAGARGLIGSLTDKFTEGTNLHFDVSALWDAEELEGGGIPDGVVCELEKRQQVSSSAGEVSGSIVAERSGAILFRWSNFHSLIRSKVISSFSIRLNDAAVGA